MSYILDGLKKLEEKRKQETLPDLFSLQTETVRKKRRVSLWVYIFCAVLLLNAAILLWRGGFPSPAGRNAGTRVSAQLPANPGGSGTPLRSSPARSTTQAGPLQEGKSGGVPKNTIAPSDTGTGSRQEIMPPSPQKPRVADAAAPKQPTGGKAKAPTDGRLLNINDLPQDVRNSLPNLRMSLHFYSTEVQARFAKINDTTVHEGDILADGLKVVEITPGGVVFSAQGHRFQMGINENR